MSHRYYVSEEFRALVIKGLRDSGMSQLELSKELGKDDTWANKIISGRTKTITEDDKEKLCELFQHETMAFEVASKRHHPSILLLDEACQDDPAKLKIVDALTELFEENNTLRKKVDELMYIISSDDPLSSDEKNEIARAFQKTRAEMEAQKSNPAST